MRVSRSTVDLVSMIGTIVFKGTECTSGNVTRLLSGSNRLRVVVKLKYCCRVEGESLISAIPLISFNDKFQREKRRDYD